MRQPDIDLVIGRSLRRRRRQLDLTLQALAARTGVGFQQIQKYECGQHRMSAATLVRLAVGLEVSVDYFFEGLPRVELAPAER
jgi:transcriptional regulator with XRE-family HTH domain